MLGNLAYLRVASVRNCSGTNLLVKLIKKRKLNADKLPIRSCFIRLGFVVVVVVLFHVIGKS